MVSKFERFSILECSPLLWHDRPQQQVHHARQSCGRQAAGVMAGHGSLLILKKTAVVHTKCLYAQGCK